MFGVLNRGLRNGVLVLLLIPLYYLLAITGFLPPTALMPVVVSGIIFVVVFVAIVVAQFTAFSKVMSRYRVLKRYQPHDPSRYTRLVKDGVNGAEFLIEGDEHTLFRTACLRNWQFVTVDKKSDWMVLDARGNDVSNHPLSHTSKTSRLYLWFSDRIPDCMSPDEYD